MSPLPVHVVKVGGSLLARRDFASRLQTWLANQSPAHHVLIAGGGGLADVLRQWDDLHSIGEERSHWLCVRALSLSSWVLAATLPNAIHLTQFAELQNSLQSACNVNRDIVIVFDMYEFLMKHEPNLPPKAVPHDWSVTTDSLAARLAEVIVADEVVLLKSLPPFEPSASLAELANREYIDSHFPLIATRLRRVSFQVI